MKFTVGNYVRQQLNGGPGNIYRVIRRTADTVTFAYVGGTLEKYEYTFTHEQLSNLDLKGYSPKHIIVAKLKQ